MNGMKRIGTSFVSVGLALAAGQASAVGLDRSGQRIGALFEDRNHFEFSLGYTDPTLEGSSSFGGVPTGNVADSFLLYSFGLKIDITDKLSFAIIGDEPFGADVSYPNDPATSILGGTAAIVDSFALTALGRYKFTDRWSVHGGVRYQQVSAAVTTSGLAFGAINGYTGVFGNDGAFGYVIGGAFEIPEIALRVSLTYNSTIEHDLPTSEFLSGVPFGLLPFGLPTDSTTEVTTPDSINLSFQSGIAENTLIFGAIRYAQYSETVVEPIGFGTLTGGSPLTDLEDGFDAELGIGRRFNEKWSGSLTIGFTTVGDDNLVSPLGPNNGSRFISVGARYNVNDNMSVAGGVRVTALGSAFSSPGGTPVAFFDGNTAVSFGANVAYKF